MRKTITILIVVFALGALVFYYSNYLSSNSGEENFNVATATVSIVGTWKSTDDTKASIIFKDGGSYSDTYEGEGISEGNWIVYEKEEAEYDPSGVFLRIIVDGGEFEYAILTSNEETLTLSYLARGNTLNYTRIKDSFEFVR